MERAQNRLAILLQLTAGLAERMDLEAIASFVLGVGLDAIEANRGTLCLLTPDGRFFEVVAHKGYDTEMMDSWRRFALDAPLPASDAVRTRTPIYLHSPAERAARYPIFANTGGDGASAMLPLIIGDEPLGAIVFGFDGEREFDDGDRSFLGALTTQCATALDRARLYEAALRRQSNLALVADASSVLAAAGDDLDSAMQQLADLSSPALADITSIHLLEPEAQLRLVATSFAADIDAPEDLGRAMRTGEEVAWDYGIIVPMLARGRVLGACVFANRSHRVMTDEDRQLARTLGGRAAVLLDNARLMRLRKEVSNGLQAALLPPLLPTIEGFEVGARYQPAGEGLDVGGDFYDVVPIAAGRTLLVVGDVSGHGVKAAAATGLVRHTIRSAAMMGLSPSRILDHANNAMLNSAGTLPTGTYCTIALAMLIPAGLDGAPTHAGPTIVVSCGGHPPPMLRRADGNIEQLDCHGRLLGYFPAVEANELTVEMAPGDTLIAFTDGVIERHVGADWFQEQDLTELVAKTDLDADALAGLICDAVVDAFPAPPSDDLAILVLRRKPAT